MNNYFHFIPISRSSRVRSSGQCSHCKGVIPSMQLELEALYSPQKFDGCLMAPIPVRDIDDGIDDVKYRGRNENDWYRRSLPNTSSMKLSLYVWIQERSPCPVEKVLLWQGPRSVFEIVLSHPTRNKASMYRPTDFPCHSNQHPVFETSKTKLFGRLIQCRTGHGYAGDFYLKFGPSANTACP